MQIHGLAPSAPGPAQETGTPPPPPGVGPDDDPARAAAQAPVPVAPPRASIIRNLGLVAIASLSLLGQGERSFVDERFISPSATLRTYWASLQAGDAVGAWDCLVEGRYQPPLPGMLWFLPPTDELTLDGFRSLPVTGGRVLVSYEVRYRPVGGGAVRSFRSADELVRMRGEWRIARPVGEVSMPEWQPTPRRVDT